jgi:hypothetical protein
LHEIHANRDLHEIHANRFHQYVSYNFLPGELANRDLHEFHANRDLQIDDDFQALFVTQKFSHGVIRISVLMWCDAGQPATPPHNTHQTATQR